MKEQGKRVSPRWRTATVLALGAIIGTMLVAQPAGAHFLPSISHIWAHIKPKADQRYVQKSAIKTIQGDWALGLQAANTGDDGWDNISFGFKLSTAPQAHFMTTGALPTAECPGTVANPTAAAGHLCVYEQDSTNRASVTIFAAGPALSGAADKWGAGLWLQPTAAGNSWSYGTWAVKAGAGVTLSRPAPSARPGS